VLHDARDDILGEELVARILLDGADDDGLAGLQHT
jgi:hypothetical protein